MPHFTNKTYRIIRTFSDRLAAIVIFAAISTLDHDPAMATSFREGFDLVDKLADLVLRDARP